MGVSTNHCKLPNLFLAGVNKAGTTALYSYLGKHPQICQSFTKEINFFRPLLKHQSLLPLEEYAKYFSHCKNEMYRLDATPSYFYGKEVIAEKIKTIIADAKIIIILRDPTERLVSLFSRAVADSRLPADANFHEFLTISEKKLNSEGRDLYSRGIREGIYIKFIRPWQKSFGANFKIVFFDDLKNNAFDLTVDLCKWLAIDINCLDPKDFTVENRTLQYRNRNLHKYVTDIYMRSLVFWRKHHKLKQRLRSIYNIVNADTQRKIKSVDATAILRLRATYAPYNKELKSFLESHDYHSLPSWLN